MRQPLVAAQPSARSQFSSDLQRVALTLLTNTSGPRHALVHCHRIKPTITLNIVGSVSFLSRFSRRSTNASGMALTLTGASTEPSWALA